MQQYRMPPLPEVTKNLIIINVIMYVLSLVFYPTMHNNFALYPFHSELFQPYQVVTHMFMHAAQPYHIFFNMFSLFILGRDTEYAMGAKKFLIFYLVTGFGALFLHQLVGYFEYQYLLQAATVEQMDIVKNKGAEAILQGKNFTNEILANLNAAMNGPAVGASGAIYGVLAAFGMLFPNRMLMLIFPPIPMKAKYFVLILAGLSLYLGVSGTMGGVAHFAHLGGAVFGAILIWYWRQKGERF